MLQRREATQTTLKALVSIHDVMPSTMEDTSRLLALCAKNQIHNITLLVVPGLNWDSVDLDRIRDWQASGIEIAGHGWLHRCREIKSLRHRLHSLCLSRNVAEHLCLDQSEELQLMRDNFQWFIEQGIAPPKLYVPPAWALRLSHRSSLLATLPFEAIETLDGLLHCASQTKTRLPLVGFEADTLLRKLALDGFNSVSRKLALLKGKPLRISLHPKDDQLLLRPKLEDILASNIQAVPYADFYDRPELSPMID